MRSTAPSGIEVTILTKVNGPITKRISLASDGKLASDGAACVMWEGTAQRARFEDMHQFATCIETLNSDQAIALGALTETLPDHVQVATKDKLAALGAAAPRNVVSRTRDYIGYRSGMPALALLDIDTKGMPQNVREKISSIGGYMPALLSVLPSLSETAQVVRRSTSTGISRTDTGEHLVGSDGFHVFVLVANGADIERFIRTLHSRCWLIGFGWTMVGATGQLLERSLVDRMVYAPDRLVFEGAPVLEPPLVQDKRSRKPTVVEGLPLDTTFACRNLSLLDNAKLRELRQAEARRLEQEIKTARRRHISRRAADLVSRVDCSDEEARYVAEMECDGVLLPGIQLPFDCRAFVGTTVADVLADPARFEGATLNDIWVGSAYTRCNAMIMIRDDGTPFIHSFAHGRTIYELKHDRLSIEAAITAVPAAQVVALFVRLLLHAELNAIEEQDLRDLVLKRSGTKARPLNAAIKAAREKRRRDQREDDRPRGEEAAASDARIRIDVPRDDDEVLPVLQAIDEVLLTSKLTEPALRSTSTWPVEVRARAAGRLHAMSTADVNTTEQPDAQKR